MKFIVALDPGSDKCGYAQIGYDLSLKGKGIAFLGELSRVIKTLIDPRPEAIVIGQGTAAKVVRKLLEELNLGIDLRYSDERNTTFEARARYFRDHPPKGLWRLVPLSFQLPPVPVDDYAACLIGERYLVNNHLTENGHRDTEAQRKE